MTNQANTQQAIQNFLGVQTTAQQNAPSSNNGNPNTVYNTATPNTTGGGGATPAPWIGTMAANPINMPFNTQGLLPQFSAGAGGGSVVDDLLARLRQPSTNTGGGSIPVPKPPGPTTPGPGTGNPQGPGTGAPSQGIPAGPISGPTWNNPHNQQGNYNNANPSIPSRPFGNWYGNIPTGTGPNQYNPRTLDLLNTIGQQTGVQLINPQTGQPASGTGLINTVRSWLSNTSQEVLDSLGFKDANGKFDWRQFLDVITEPFISGDWYNSQEGKWNNPMEVLQGMIPGNIMQMLQREAPQVWQQTQDKLNQSYQQAAQRAMAGVGGGTSWNAQQYYNSRPEMSRQELDRLLNHLDTIRLTRGGGSSWMQGQMDEDWNRIKEIFYGRSFAEN